MWPRQPGVRQGGADDGHQRPREGDAPTVAAGVAVRRAVEEVWPEDGAGERGSTAMVVGGGRRDVEVGADGAIQRGGLLEDHADPAAKAERVEVGDVVAVEAASSSVGDLQPVAQAQQRRLSGARQPDDDSDPASRSVVVTPPRTAGPPRWRRTSSQVRTPLSTAPQFTSTEHRRRGAGGPSLASEVSSAALHLRLPLPYGSMVPSVMKLGEPNTAPWRPYAH